MKYKNFYFISMLAVALASVYPVYMGIVTLISHSKNGFINVSDYQKYIIPYTPVCIALIVSTALMPLMFIVFKRYTLPAVSILGMLLFFVSELSIEQIRVVEGYTNMPLESWQLSLCMATPEVLSAIGEPIYAANNPAFKIHFYIIAIVIILAVLNVIYGFSKMFREHNFRKRRPLIAQAVLTAVFIGLCILACLTAFYRNGTINISPLSALLMSVFFIVFGNTAGIYIGSVFYGKSKPLSNIIPAITASLTTLVMYIGELVLMDGVLFKYGKGFIFKPLNIIPFSIVDIFIILASGVLAYYILRLLHDRETVP